MPRKRNRENKHLPTRWRFTHGAYYYQVPIGCEDQWDGKKTFRLGTTYPEACRVWADRFEDDQSDITTIGELMDRYIIETIPHKSPKTQKDNLLSLKKLRPIFGDMRLEVNNVTQLQPKHGYQYLTKATKKHGATSAKHDFQVLRHLLTKATEWGLINRNPLLGHQVQIKSNPPRDRDVEDWEAIEAISLGIHHPGKPKPSRGPVICSYYIRFKIMTGLRRTDILKLKHKDIKEDGIHVKISKTSKTTAKTIVIEWDNEGELGALINEIKAIPPFKSNSDSLFITREGKAYIDDFDECNAFDSMWQRFMRKAINDTNLVNRFQERDLRAKTATDSSSLEEAQLRLTHSSSEVTNRVYRRKPSRIKPLLTKATKRLQKDK